MRSIAFSALLSLCVVLLAGEDPPSPEKIRASLMLPEGLVAEFVASEPEISSPVAMAFDENRVLFVVEMLDYPNAAKGQPPLGRIKRLEDRDGDGRYEHATVFADNLLMANGLLPWRGGLIVTAAPQILFLKDEDRDGVSEAREVWFEGFAQQNPQLRSSHPTLGLDNFIYVTNGAKGGNIRRAGVADAPSLALGSGDFRFDARDPRGGVYEAVSGFGQFGLTFDDFGARFVCTNRNHWIHLPMESRYFARNSHLAAPPAARDDQRAGGSAQVYPISRNKTLAATHAGSFTAACGVYVYRGSALPEKFRGAIFTCEPSGNLIHAERLIPDGATFRGEPFFDKKEFLASAESWFRPVNLAGGPDGALYVVDMCRADVEHPDWVPQHLRHRYDFEGDKNRGRIWRIVAKDATPNREKPGFGAVAAEGLVRALENPNDWWRMTAQRLLLEKNARQAAPLLKKLANDSALPQARLHALMLLNAFNELDAPTLEPRLGDVHPRVREGALALAEMFLARAPWDVNTGVAACIADNDPRVRYQAALTLGSWRNEAMLPLLAALARRDGADRWTRLAIASAVAGHSEQVLEALLIHDEVAPEMLRELALLVGAEKDRGKIASVVAALGKASFQARATVLLGIMDGLSRRGERLEKILNTLPAETQETIQHSVKQAREILADRAQTIELRVAAARVLRLDGSQAIVTLAAALERDEPQALQLAALTALEAFPGEGSAAVIFARLRTQLPAVRRESLRVLTAQPMFMAELVKALEQKKIQRGDLDGDAVRVLKAATDAALKERIAALLKDPAAEDRDALLKRYRAVVNTGADPKRGRAAFEQNCATCHKLGSIGTNVGPDISDTFGRDAEALLADILNPNAAIDTNFTAYVVKTNQGAVLNGIVAAQNASSITLRSAGGKDETLLMQDVAEVRSTGLSLMPEGLEQALSPEALRDLIAYIRNWRDVEGK